PELYERFEQVVLVHGVRWAKETAVVRHRIETLRSHELLGEEVRAKLRYYPTVTREPYVNRGRLTALIESGRLFRDLALPPLDPGADRLMVCGSPATLSASARPASMRSASARARRCRCRVGPVSTSSPRLRTLPAAWIPALWRSKRCAGGKWLMPTYTP